MINKIKLAIAIITLYAAGSQNIQAQKPFVQTNYTADPAPMVYNDRMYVYTSHDEDNSTWFTMDDWRVYSTNDMVNWTDHGAILHYTHFTWARSDAWAPQCIERNGKFYMYVPLTSKENNRSAIGVAVANTPLGPFYDPLGKPLAQTDWGDIDPTVFIDDDGQAYLYWGNPDCYYVKLNEDMISLEGEIVKVPMTEESFARREGNERRPTTYEEGPWLYKKDKLYYLFWAGGPLPEHLGYSTSKSPIGPWKYGGVIMNKIKGSFTNHPGVIDFRGKTYLFYHSGTLPGGGGFNRSVCVQELPFNKDGSIPLLDSTTGISQPLATINPYVKNEAETIAWSEGVKAHQNDLVGVFITATRDSAYTVVRNVDFRSHGATRFYANVGTTHNSDIAIEVRLGAVDGKLLTSQNIRRTGGSDRWRIIEAKIEKITGTHDLYFIFRGKDRKDVLFFDYWRFAK